MKTRKAGAVLRQVRTLFNVGATGGLTDGQLLERFATGHGEATELAFAALVERHGAMVLRVCRARLADPHDAMDAYQATFLVLVQKARALWVRDSLGPWLHQVALRTASCARATAARRHRLERQAAEAAAGRDGTDGAVGAGWEQVLHEEIDRLPERYRVPIVLCDLEGHTCEEAARRMGRPVGTVKAWRSRGRERLRARLTRSGLAPSAGLAAALAAGAADAALPPSTAEEAVRTAVRAAASGASAGVVPASVSALVNGVLKEMFMNMLRKTVAILLALAMVTAGLGAAARVAAKDVKEPSDEAPPEAPRPAARRILAPPPHGSPKSLGDDAWQLSLREALRLGLDNSEALRLVHADATGSFVIQPGSADTDPWRFKAEVMAHARSIEQQYWSLVQQHAQLWAAEKAVELAEEILKREQSGLEAGRGKVSDLAEAQRRLEQFRLDLVTKTADVITTERRLREILGLPLSVGRRIVPATAPTEAHLDPDWESSRATMLEKQPDIAQAKARAVDRQDAFVQQVIHQTVHSLARFFLELDASYKLFQAATRYRTAAAQKLEVQRGAYEGGGGPVDRYLDAVGQYAGAVAQEAQFKTSYNISIVAFEEAKGTLLEHDRITVAERPRSPGSAVAGPDGAASPASFPAPAPTGSGDRRDAAAPPSKEDQAGPAAPKDEAAGKTLTFRFTVGSGPRPVEIRGSFTVAPARAVDGERTP